MSEGNGAPVISKQPVVERFEIHIAWMPATGQVQVATSNNMTDDVLKFGLLEMAKTAILKMSITQQAQAPLIVPGRFAS